MIELCSCVSRLCSCSCQLFSGAMKLRVLMDKSYAPLSSKPLSLGKGRPPRFSRHRPRVLPAALRISSKLSEHIRCSFRIVRPVTHDSRYTSTKRRRHKARVSPYTPQVGVGDPLFEALHLNIGGVVCRGAQRIRLAAQVTTKDYRIHQRRLRSSLSWQRYFGPRNACPHRKE